MLLKIDNLSSNGPHAESKRLFLLQVSVAGPISQTLCLFQLRWLLRLSLSPPSLLAQSFDLTNVEALTARKHRVS